MQYHIELTDSEIRAWMDHEMERLGEWCVGFCITWSCNEQYYWAEITSETKVELSHERKPFGRILHLGEISDTSGDSLASIQHEARSLWHRLHKDYRIRRDLGAR